MSVSAQQLIHIANKTPSFTHTQTHLHAHTQPQLHAPTIFLPPRRERFLYRSLPRSLCSCSVVPLYTHVLASCRSLVLSFFRSLVLSFVLSLSPHRSFFLVLAVSLRLALPLASESRHGF
jgi:hypothetical protein